MRFVNSVVIITIAAISMTADWQSDGRAVLAAQLSPDPSASQKLFEELAEKDLALFDAVFNTCNLETLGELITEDFEFYHDKHGQIAKSRTEFVEAIRTTCERQKKGLDYRARRELVKGSVVVYPLNKYGAIQMGVHRFYAKAEGKEDRLTEVAKFTHVWKKDGDQWRVSRVLSYDHKPAE